jgi:phosphoenolpyruvate synthase/pyruvate phosphate dikinase
MLLRKGIKVPPGFVIPTGDTDTLNDNIVKEAQQQFDALGAQYVAVRSSAAAEDGDTASWAGQFDTFLFVDRKSLISKIKLCIASTASERSTQYGQLTGAADRCHRSGYDPK